MSKKVTMQLGRAFNYHSVHAVLVIAAEVQVNSTPQTV